MMLAQRRSEDSTQRALLEEEGAVPEPTVSADHQGCEEASSTTSMITPACDNVDQSHETEFQLTQAGLVHTALLRSLNLFFPPHSGFSYVHEILVENYCQILSFSLHMSALSLRFQLSGTPTLSLSVGPSATILTNLDSPG